MGSSGPEEFNRWRAAHSEALQLAERLCSSARVFRRYAGELKYFPQAERQPEVGGDLREAATSLRNGVTAAMALAARWDQELMWLRSVDPDSPADALQREHARAREAITLLRAALDLFQRAVGEPERASLDAPYGAGAPRRVHPGAQCTWVAERAENLFRELSNLALRKENLLLAVERAPLKP